MSKLQTLSRALDVLYTISEAESAISVADIARKVQLPESTAYRLIQNLEENGIVERKGKNKIYLGLKILDLAKNLYQQLDRELCLVAAPIMEELTQKVEETSILNVRTGMDAICIKFIESSRLVRFVTERGRVIPLHVSASGKAILAFESKKIIERVINNIGNEEYRKNLLESLEDIRKQGYSLTIGEADRDVFGLAAPIFDQYGRVMASLTIAGPESRLDKDKQALLIKNVKSAANKISTKLKEVSGNK